MSSRTDMSTIDLNKLIAQKKFFVPAKSSDLYKLILEQLEFEALSWSTETERPRSGTFSRDMRIKWAIMTITDKGLSLSADVMEQYKLEYDKDIFNHRREVLGRSVDSTPHQFHYVVTKETADGCTCEVTCFPALYFKIGIYNIACDEANFQLAKQRCEEFLVDIFVGGLGGKEIAERREVSQWELLINDVDCRHATDRIYQMLEQATGEVLLMGWVGTDCLPKLKELKNKGVTIQAVTHKPSEMKSPVPKDIGEGYTNLVKILGKTNVSTNRELHGRAIIVDNKALIGSMDMNAHSLSGEHREFAIYTEDVDTVRKIRAYFKKIFVPLKQDQ